MRNYKCFLWLLLVVNIYAAFELQTVNSEIMAIGGITSMHLYGNNPGIFDNTNKFSISSNYTNLFGIKDLHCWDFGMYYNLWKNNAVSLKTNSVGNDIYQENTYQIGFSRKLVIPVSIGFSFSLYNLSIGEFPTENTFGMNLGIIYYFSDNVHASSLFGNINRPKICNDKELLPEYFAFGLSWKIIPRIKVLSEIFKDTIYPFNTRFGTVVKLHNNIHLYSGLQTNPDRLSSGISIRIFNVNFISSMQTHMKLPNTFYFGCTFHIK